MSYYLIILHILYIFLPGELVINQYGWVIILVVNTKIICPQLSTIIIFYHHVLIFELLFIYVWLESFSAVEVPNE